MQAERGSWLDLGQRGGGMSRGEFRTQNTGSGAVVLTKGTEFAISPAPSVSGHWYWCIVGRCQPEQRTYLVPIANRD